QPATANGSEDLVLDIQNLRKIYFQSAGIFSGGGGYEVKALNDISLHADRGMTLAIVGESGCGKSTLAKVLTGLEEATEGAVRLEGADIGRITVEKRGTDIKRKLQMVFQNPDSTLNPSHSVGYAIERSVRRLRNISGREAKDLARKLIETVKLPGDFMSRKPR